jgi:hypothetical protein
VIAATAGAGTDKSPSRAAIINLSAKFIFTSPVPPT